MKATERDYRDFLEDMARYADKGMHIVDNLDYDAFLGNEEKVLAAIRVLEVIGEAAKHVPPTVRENYPESLTVPSIEVQPNYRRAYNRSL